MKTLEYILDQIKRTKKLEIFTYECVSEEGRYNGHSSVDVHCIYDLNPLDIKNLSFYKYDIINYLTNLKEFYIDPLIYKGRLKQFLDKDLFNTWVVKHRPMQIKQESWVFVIDSKKACIEYAAGDEVDYKNKSSEQYKLEVQDKIQNEGGRLFTELLKDYHKVSPSMWVSLTDPTVFILDESYHKFDLPDGWSDQELTKLVTYWINVMYPGLDKFEVVYAKGKE